MTIIKIELPDGLAKRASKAGLLSDAAIQQLLEEAMRRQAGRALLDMARRLQAAGIEPMTMDEIDAEVKVARRERRERETAKS